LIGGFLTPPLLSTGVDNPLGLFTYIAILDIGIITVALKKRWGFLWGLSALGTLAIQIGWVDKFFTIQKALTGIVVFVVFSFLYGLAEKLAERKKIQDQWTRMVSAFYPVLASLFTGYLISFHELAARPGLVFTFLFFLNGIVAYLASKNKEAQWAHMANGGLGFVFLGIWTGQSFTLNLLPWGLSFYLLFATLHTIYPIVLQKQFPENKFLRIAGVFPALMLSLFAFPLSHMEQDEISRSTLDRRRILRPHPFLSPLSNF